MNSRHCLLSVTELQETVMAGGIPRCAGPACNVRVAVCMSVCISVSVVLHTHNTVLHWVTS